MKNFFKSITEAINNLKAGKIDINRVDTIKIEETEFNLSQNGDNEFTLCITKEYDIKYDITNDIYPNSIDFLPYHYVLDPKDGYVSLGDKINYGYVRPIGSSEATNLMIEKNKRTLTL
jgi:hypothetical protein